MNILSAPPHMNDWCTHFSSLTKLGSFYFLLHIFYLEHVYLGAGLS